MKTRAVADFEIAEIESIDEENIDPKIRPIVVTLWALGFSTAASCEGHLGHTQGGQTPYPWILFLNESKSISEEDEIEYLKETNEQTTNLSQLLEAYYAQRPLPAADERLIIDYGEDTLAEVMDEVLKDTPAVVHQFYVFDYVLRCAGGDFLDMLPAEVLDSEKRGEVLKRHQREMESFGAFLLNQFGE